YTFYISFFLFHTTASTEIYTLSLHDALPICGQAYSQTVFFEDERAFKDFTSGHFEFGADASAVAITAAAEASAGTAGASAGASRSEEHTSELQSPYDLVCRLLLEKKKKQKKR